MQMAQSPSTCRYLCPMSLGSFISRRSQPRDHEALHAPFRRTSTHHVESLTPRRHRMSCHCFPATVNFPTRAQTRASSTSNSVARLCCPKPLITSTDDHQSNRSGTSSLMEQVPASGLRMAKGSTSLIRHSRRVSAMNVLQVHRLLCQASLHHSTRP